MCRQMIRYKKPKKKIKSGGGSVVLQPHHIQRNEVEVPVNSAEFLNLPESEIPEQDVIHSSLSYSHSHSHSYFLTLILTFTSVLAFDFCYFYDFSSLRLTFFYSFQCLVIFLQIF
jgi:hypothetical protein